MVAKLIRCHGITWRGENMVAKLIRVAAMAAAAAAAPSPNCHGKSDASFSQRWSQC
jgi:hypothetical protein